MKFSAAEPLTVAMTRSPVKGVYCVWGERQLGGNVLGGWSVENGRTRPLLYSTRAAFFLLSVTRVPATVEVTVLGGMWRRPGPRVSVFFLPVPVGRACAGMISPGRTTSRVVAMAMAERESSAGGVRKRTDGTSQASSASKPSAAGTLGNF